MLNRRCFNAVCLLGLGYFLLLEFSIEHITCHCKPFFFCTCRNTVIEYNVTEAASWEKSHYGSMTKHRTTKHRKAKTRKRQNILLFRSVTIQFHIVFDSVNTLHCVPTPPGSPYMYVRYLFSSGTRTQFSGVFSRDLRLC